MHFATNRPSIAGRKELVNKNRIYLKSYAKTEENRGFQFVMYVKGHISEQEQQDGREGWRSRTERKKEAKKENRTLIVL